VSITHNSCCDAAQSVGVSAVTGEGMPELFAAVDKCRAEYDREYLPTLQAKQQVPPRRRHPCTGVLDSGDRLVIPVLA